MQGAAGPRQPPHVQEAGPGASGAAKPGPSCGPWWSAFLANAQADVPHAAGHGVSCRDFTSIHRQCSIDRTDRGAFLHCMERRELFKLCTDREPEKVSTTNIETREPLLDAHTMVATPSTRFELAPPRQEPHTSLPTASSDRTEQQPQQEQLTQQPHGQRPLSPGRFSHPWRVHADDGGVGSSTSGNGGNRSSSSCQARSEDDVSSSCSSSSSGGRAGGDSMVLTPQVGQAMDDIFLFADEMQRELAQHGLLLVRQGEEEQHRRKQQQQQPGLLARLFGARAAGEALERAASGLGNGGGVAPLRSSDYQQPQQQRQQPYSSAPRQL